MIALRADHHVVVDRVTKRSVSVVDPASGCSLLPRPCSVGRSSCAQAEFSTGGGMRSPVAAVAGAADPRHRVGRCAARRDGERSRASHSPGRTSDGRLHSIATRDPQRLASLVESAPRHDLEPCSLLTPQGVRP
ncbi:hypothetical protein C5E08_03960 [Rathayibacter iranicus]|uniref:Uncharacterized protein n=1 Tax=Rathayibacter iranicus TaxID=59737 RepID=A0AAD1AD02_9MICO|nr:hypothetical protein C7V51_03975 [Rathayibacter iranicus]PPI49450.1 hypothetical protein C5E09_03050 [Rathayibacter iranicus]PPI61814.1 hypothetical protein C5E08_03960 [Rathayibacter iranicus]PPI73390.1 hypothetical protein C5E01_03030 [Rathayibacter iranicus]